MPLRLWLKGVVDKQRPIKIGILGHVGNDNLGDEAIIAALVANLQLRLPDAELVGFTMNPSDTTARHGITAFRVRRGRAGSERRDDPAAVAEIPRTHRKGLRERLRSLSILFLLLKRVQSVALGAREAVSEIPFLVRAYRRLSGMSLLILAGSQQMSDAVRGPWGFPYALFKWTLLARLRRIPVAVVSVGAGPINSAVSRWFVKRTVSMAAYRSYRDEISRDVIRSLGFKEPGEVAPDLALSLPVGSDLHEPAAHLTVAINPMPFIWQEYDAETERVLYSGYADTMAAFAVWLIDRGYRVAFLATQMRGDPPVIRDIVSRVTETRPDLLHGGHVAVYDIRGLDDLLRGLRSASIVVATRFHGVVLGCHVGRPVLALAYHPKTRDLMDQMGDGAYAVPAQHVRLTELQTTFLDLEQHRHEVAARRQSRLPDMRIALADQYDRVLECAHLTRGAFTEPPTSVVRVA